MGGLYFPKQQLRRNCEQRLEQGMPSFNNFPFSRNNLCSCSSQFETGTNAWQCIRKSSGMHRCVFSLKQMQMLEQHIRKSSGRHRCVFTQSVIPVVGAFLSEGGQGWNFFPTHTQVGGRNPWLIVNLFLPQSPINIQCSKCVWTQRLQDGIFSRGPIGKGHHEVMEKPLPSL